MKKRLAAWVSVLVVALSVIAAAAVPAAAQTVQEQINNSLCAGSNLQPYTTPGACASTGLDATTQIDNIVHTIVNLLSAIVGIVAVIMIIVGGFRYITSGGNDASVTSAKNTILYAIIGLVIVAMAQVIVHFVLQKITTT